MESTSLTTASSASHARRPLSLTLNSASPWRSSSFFHLPFPDLINFFQVGYEAVRNALLLPSDLAPTASNSRHRTAVLVGAGNIEHLGMQLERIQVGLTQFAILSPFLHGRSSYLRLFTVGNQPVHTLWKHSRQHRQSSFLLFQLDRAVVLYGHSMLLHHDRLSCRRASPRAR